MKHFTENTVYTDSYYEKKTWQLGGTIKKQYRGHIVSLTLIAVLRFIQRKIKAINYILWFKVIWNLLTGVFSTEETMHDQQSSKIIVLGGRSAGKTGKSCKNKQIFGL